MSENIRNEIEKELNGLKNNLEKFTTAVEIFDEAKELANNAGRQIDKTTKENKKILESSSAALTELLKEQGAHIELFEETLTKLTELQKRISESDIPANLDQINSTLEKTQTDTQSSLNKTADKLNELGRVEKENFQKIKVDLKLISDATQTIPEEFNDLREYISKSLDKKFAQIIKHHTSLEQIIVSNHKESMKWHTTQMMDLKVKFSNQIQSLKDDAMFHQKFVYGGLALIVALQLVMLYVFS